MMLRFQLSVNDIARVRIKPAPAPLTETALSLETLRTSQDHLALRQWRAAARKTLSPAWRPLTALVRPDHLWPEFLAPRTASPHPHDAIELLRSTSLRRVRAGMNRLARLYPLAPSATPLARGDPEHLSLLADATSAYFEATIAPFWQRIRAYCEADVAMRARILLTGGVDALLSTLHPTVQWRAPVLHVPSHLDADIKLSGEGLTLVPSFFNRTTALGVPDAERPLLIYPIKFDLPVVAAIWQPNGGDASLANLLGRTRAQVLRTIASGCTTAELGRNLGISPSAASEHATVLRQAGLITTQRYRNHALHTLTPLGTELLRVSQGPQ